MKELRVIRKDSGLQSGSREICLPQSFEALKSGLRISGSKRINLSQVRDLRQINGYQRELAAMMHGSKHGYPALRIIILWSLGGFLLVFEA